MRSIVLSGSMATGNSTVGPRLAARLGLKLVDTDTEIERESGRRVRDLWREEGEAAFRRREVSVVERLFADEAPRVIAFGGGTVMEPARASPRARACDFITLAASPETIVSRVGDALPDRPNLAVGGDPVARARELLEERAEAYAECHAVLATDAADADAIVDAVMAVAKRSPILGAARLPLLRR